ncbi:MAG TPA: hypothetical protein VFO34_02360 [Candidatus Acidoferrales bacterium]|nr:hypothetical protein [Candidatus Acidoferrales bacterium]
MRTIDRRTFLGSLAGSFVAASAQAAVPHAVTDLATLRERRANIAPDACWLDVAAPFVLSNKALGIETQILLTATCFPGVDGYRDPNNQTAYQIVAYDPKGNEIRLDRNGRLDIPALHTTMVEVAQLAGRSEFWGGARIRTAPSANQVSHAGDLFSAGFVRWQTEKNFDNVHAHPAAPQQAIGHFNYSMPIPSLSEYHCAFSLFNPNDVASEGSIRIVDRMAQTVVERPYHLEPHHTELFSFETLKNFASPGEMLAITPLAEKKLSDGGVVVIHNTSEAVSFAYTLMRGRDGGTWTVEHPLHFSADGEIKPARQTPFGPNGNFPVTALLYTPLLFNKKQIAGVELESRFYLSASRWVEDALWLMPFATTAEGNIAWVSNKDENLRSRVQPAALIDQGLVRLSPFQSVRVDARGLPLPAGYSGGLGVGTIPGTSHSLLKVEVHANNWNRSAFTHFRPGGQNHMKYRLVEERGGVATDYIVTDCQIRGSAGKRQRDAVLAVMNIEFQDEKTGSPKLQLFGPSGLIAEKNIGDFPPLACRHFLVSELFPSIQTEPDRPVTMRMVDQNAMMVMSAVHLDYDRRDLALEHGSDRHSTFNDFHC